MYISWMVVGMWALISLIILRVLDYILKCAFVLFSSVSLPLLFWLLFLQVVTEAWCCICELHCVAWEARSLSPPPLHHIWRCHTVSGKPWVHSVWRRLRRALFLWHFVEEIERARRAERVNRSRWVLLWLMAAGQDWNASLTFSSVVDRSSVRSEMGALGCTVLVFALFLQCHGRSVQNPMFRFKRWDRSVP